MAKTYKEVVRQFHESVRDTIVSRPDLSYAHIAKQFGVSEVTVYCGGIRSGSDQDWAEARVVEEGPEGSCLMPHKFTEAIFRAKLPVVDKAILWVLSERANANGVAWPGQSRIAGDAGCDYTTAARALKRLEAQGLITHTGWHDSPPGPVKEFTLDLKRILALGTQSGAPTVGGEGTVGGAPEKPINSTPSDDRVVAQETNGVEVGVALPAEPSDVVIGKTIAIADVAFSLRSDRTGGQQQDQAQQPNTQGATPPDPPVSPSAPTAQPPIPPPPFCRTGDPARWLANHLWMYVSVRPEVEIPYSWETWWSLDFQAALDRGWELDEMEDIIRASQQGAARKYHVRAKSICSDESLERLHKIAQALNKKGLLKDEVCPKCKAFFPDTDLVVEHYWASHQGEIDADDAAEEEAMWLADELVSEGYVAEHPELRMYYPWDEYDDQIFSPWADNPEQLPEPMEVEVEDRVSDACVPVRESEDEVVKHNSAAQ